MIQHLQGKLWGSKKHHKSTPRHFGNPSQLQLQGHWNILIELEKCCEIQASWPFIIGNLRVPSTPNCHPLEVSYGLIFQTYEKIIVPQQSPMALFPLGGHWGGTLKFTWRLCPWRLHSWPCQTAWVQGHDTFSLKKHCKHNERKWNNYEPLIFIWPFHIH